MTQLDRVPLHSVPQPPPGCCICIEDSGRCYPIRLAAVTDRRCTGMWVMGGRTFTPPLWLVYVSHVSTIDGHEHRLLPQFCIVGQVSAELEEEVYSTEHLDRPEMPRAEFRERLKAWRSHRAERREIARTGGNSRWRNVL